MKTWKVTRISGGRHALRVLYGGHWIQVSWWWDRADAVRFAREEL